MKVNTLVALITVGLGSLEAGSTDQLRAEGGRKAPPHHLLATYIEREMAHDFKDRALDVALAVVNESNRHGFDPVLLLAVIKNESRFNPSAIGAHGEMGLMQIKPVTGQWIAQKAGIEWTGAESLHDPVYNLRLGTAYLAMLRNDFGHRRPLYLAAYNMGPTQVRRLLGENAQPQIYARKTERYFTRISQELKQARQATAALAAI